MKVLGFSFSEINAKKEKALKNVAISTNIEFMNVDKDKSELLKDSELIKMDYKFSVDYKESKDQKSSPSATISFKGNLILSTSKEESKTLLDSWKKKQVPDEMKMPLLNIILKRCSIKALSLEEELGLPTHVPIPKLTIKK